MSDLSYMLSHHQSRPIRTGAIASFTNLKALSRGFAKTASMLPSFDAEEFRTKYGKNGQPPNVLNVALRLFNEADDMSETDWFRAFPDKA